MAEHAENPQFRTFMSNVSQWADQLAQFYPGINPTANTPPPAYSEEKSEVMPPAEPLAPRPDPTAPFTPEDPKADAQMEPIDDDVMVASHISTATAIEPEEELLIQIEPKNDVLAESTEPQMIDVSDDSDVEVISRTAPSSPPPSSTVPAASAQKSASNSVANPFMEDDGWMLMNKSYEELCKFYEAKREAEEKRRKEIEEQIVSVF